VLFILGDCLKRATRYYFAEKKRRTAFVFFVKRFFLGIAPANHIPQSETS